MNYLHVYLLGLIFTFIFSAIWARILPTGMWAENARIVFKKEWSDGDDVGLSVAMFIICMTLWPLSLGIFGLTILLLCWRKVAGLFDKKHLDKGNTSQGGFR